MSSRVCMLGQTRGLVSCSRKKQFCCQVGLHVSSCLSLVIAYCPRSQHGGDLCSFKLIVSSGQEFRHSELVELDGWTDDSDAKSMISRVGWAGRGTHRIRLGLKLMS